MERHAHDGGWRDGLNSRRTPRPREAASYCLLMRAAKEGRAPSPRRRSGLAPSKSPSRASISTPCATQVPSRHPLHRRPDLRLPAKFPVVYLPHGFANSHETRYPSCHPQYAAALSIHTSATVPTPSTGKSRRTVSQHRIVDYISYACICRHLVRINSFLSP